MPLHFSDGDYSCDNLLDGDDQLYTVVAGPRGVGLQQRAIPGDEIIGLEVGSRIQRMPCREAVALLRSGVVVDPTVPVVGRDEIYAGQFYPRG